MNTSRRGFLALAGAVGAEGHSHAQNEPHEHEHQAAPSDPALRVKALESLLVEKGFVDPAALDAVIDTFEHKVGPRNGARVVARAWVDRDHMVVVENEPKVHNLVVCTLCSCYPWAVLGLPPIWYKSAAYRSRAVIDPRGVLSEFGSTLRYLVLPERPPATENLTEDHLAALVTRDAMVGVAKVTLPVKWAQA